MSQYLRFMVASLLLSSPLHSISTREKMAQAKQDEKGEVIPDWIVHWEIARVLSYQKKYVESLREYEEVLKLKPDVPEVRTEMAVVLLYNGQKEEALQLLEQIPSDQWNDAARLVAASIYASHEKYNRAEALYLDYLSRNPNDLKVRFKYAELLSWAKRYDDSLAEYKKLMAERPDDTQLRRRYAMVLIWSGQQEEGIKELKNTLPPKEGIKRRSSSS